MLEEYKYAQGVGHRVANILCVSRVFLLIGGTQAETLKLSNESF